MLLSRRFAVRVRDGRYSVKPGPDRVEPSERRPLARQPCRIAQQFFAASTQGRGCRTRRGAYGVSGPAPTGQEVRTYEETYMSWKAPTIVEIALGAEINSYACAEAKK